jgi:predicted transposase YdaD
MADKPFDATLKTLVETEPECWPVFVGQPAAPVEVIDAGIAAVTGAADKVLRVRAAEPYLLHLEFVAGHDAAKLPIKLNLRSLLLEDRHGLPVLSVAILLRPQADSPGLSGNRLRSLPGDTPYNRFRYRVVRVWRLAPEPLLEGGLGTLPLAAIADVTEAELPGIIREMEERLDRPRGRRRSRDLWAATFILLGLRYSSAMAARLLQGVVSMKESTTYQMILAEGEALGISKGALAEAKKMLRILGESRFGEADARTLATLEAIDDLGQLEELGVRLLNVESWQELLKGYRPRRSARPRNGR